ncbi:SCO7613 C-terminal domain-containing membrane protein [Streptomyces sp. NPDC019890]|uniref:SCO7613 C-terminal domain-containing membrane protein n=1 Tax=Streptomyces sp. NPDC019890 TaxID=3365064 RepID=UPI0038511E0D
MENVPPPAEELAILDRELVQLDARRSQLLARRAWLLAALQPPAAPAPAARPFAAPPFAAPPFATPPFATRPFAASPRAASPSEASQPSVQNLLLTLGGILLTIAAIAFTLVSWGHLGIGGRSLVLGAVTVAALAAPVALLRRGLASTAESLAGLGLVLMVLDSYALHVVALPDTGGLAYSAVASAVLAALWAAYGLSLNRLRIPLPVAVLTAQLPLPLWALTASAGAPSLEWALLATAALDVALALWAKPAGVRGIATAGAAVTGGWALLIGGVQSVTADSPLDAVAPAVLLVAAAGVALFAAWRSPSAAAVSSATAGLATIAGIGGVARAAVPEGWSVLGYLLCAVGLLGLVRVGVPQRLRPGLIGAAGVIHAVAALWTLPLVALTLVGPLTGLDDIWSGTPADARGALGAPLPESGPTAAPLVLLILAATLTAASRRPFTEPPSASEPSPEHRAATAGTTAHPADHSTASAHPAGTPPQGHPAGVRPGWAPHVGGAPASRVDRRAAALTAAVALAWVGLFVVPPALDLTYAATVTIHLLLTAAALLIAVRPARATAAVALACALSGAASVAVLSLATRPATFTVLGTLTVALALSAVASRAGRAVQAILACAAAGFATALVGALAAAADLPPHQVAPAILAVPAAVALIAARLGRHPAALPLECTGAAAGLLAVALATEDRPTLALVLALGGVIAAGTAVRAERRPAAGYLAAVLFVLATWVRLAASDVSVPEAYTLPVTVPALAVGLLRRRRDPQASSWTAYGPGLAATLLPSLVAAWGDEHWLRPLLLGVAALAVTLAGARLRLQSLLVLGGAVLALDALHELAPYVVQVVGALPRWLPPALAGLLLLAVGATYEQRLRDARRLRDALGRMH